MKEIFSIPQPCNEDWDKMKIGLHSRYCTNCEKQVKDFTQMDRLSILQYLWENQSKKTCGRFNISQLDYTREDTLITIQTLNRQHKNSNLSFYLLAASSLLLGSCQNEVPEPISDASTKISPVENPDSAVTDSIKFSIETSVHPFEVKNIEPIVSTVLYGDINYVGKQTEPYYFTDTMPEFPGGIDSLQSYLQTNLKYPFWENKQRIQGVVYVQFVVDKQGKIRNPEITESVKDSKNFDGEVLRIINNMPDWIPGIKDGEKVDVIFSLPVKFKLK